MVSDTPLPMIAPITPAEALQIVLDFVRPLAEVQLPHSQVLGMTLSRDVHSGVELPPFDNSAMDGYAVVAADLAAAGPGQPVTLSLLETIGAGEVATATVQPGTCLKIMTGAPLPAGADAVVMREETEQQGARIGFLAKARRGQNIRLKGSDVHCGELVLPAGTAIGAAQWAMLACLGQATVPVRPRPRLAIIATGAELVDVDAPLLPGQIHDSNSFALRGAALDCAAEVVAVRRVGDSLEELTAALQELAPLCDAIVTSGGVSAGDFDPVRDVMHRDARILFWKIAMKPGKPLLFADYLGVPLFGLPGNPVSVMVAWEEFVRPALLRLAGRAALNRPVVRATVQNGFTSPLGRVEYVRACVKLGADDWTATTTGDQGSGRLSSMLGSNALLVVPAETTRVQPGDRLPARLTNCPEVTPG